MKAFSFLMLLLTICDLQAEAVNFSIGEMHLHGEKAAQPEYAVESGQEVRLEIPIDAPLGSKVTLEPEFFQLASGLGAPIALPMDFETPQPDFKETTHQVVTVSLTAYEVKKITRFLIRFSIHDGAAKKESLLSSAILLVYPKEEPGAVAKAISQKLSETNMRLIVFGESAEIRTFLEKRHIDFTSSDDWPSEVKSDALYVGQTTTKKLAEHLHSPARGHMLIFTDSDIELLPGVYRTETADAVVTKVSLHMLDTLESNPRNREIFTDLLLEHLTRTTENP